MCSKLDRVAQVIDRQTAERAAGLRTRLRIAATTTRKMFAMAALFAVGGCATMPVPMVPTQVLGTWQGSKDGANLEITDTGILVIELKDGTTLIGRCSFVQQRGTMRYQVGVAHCPQEPGEYTFVVDGSTLTTSDPADTCNERRAMMDQLWNRARK